MGWGPLSCITFDRTLRPIMSPSISISTPVTIITTSPVLFPPHLNLNTVPRSPRPIHISMATSPSPLLHRHPHLLHFCNCMTFPGVSDRKESVC